MSKTSKRRRENTALVEANWPFPDRRKTEALSSNSKATDSNSVNLRANRSGAAIYINPETGE